MARSRNIKPAFFLNDKLAENNSALGRLLFIGLWSLADYKGDLEWRAGRIKAQLLPYDECDIKQLAINLDKSGFIRFYSDGNSIYINIVNFTKHQNPHINEKKAGSEIPAYSESMRQVVDLTELTINRDLSRLKQEQDGTNPADSLLLIPDSLNLIPSHANRVNVDSCESPVADNAFLEKMFDIFWKHYQVKQGKQLAKKKFMQLLRGKTEFMARYAKDMILSYYMHCLESNVLGFDKIHPATYLNQKRWTDDQEFIKEFKAQWILENGNGQS